MFTTLTYKSASLQSAFIAHLQEIVHIGFHAVHSGFRIPGTGFQSLSVELGFCISIFRAIPDSLSCILVSKAQDSGFHKQNFLGFRIP